VSAQKTFEVPNRGESAGAAGRITLIGHAEHKSAGLAGTRAEAMRVVGRLRWS